MVSPGGKGRKRRGNGKSPAAGKGAAKRSRRRATRKAKQDDVPAQPASENALVVADPAAVPTVGEGGGKTAVKGRSRAAKGGGKKARRAKAGSPSKRVRARRRDRSAKPPGISAEVTAPDGQLAVQSGELIKAKDAWWRPRENRNVLVRLEDVTHRYRVRGESHPIIQNASFQIPRGRSIAIFGPRGAGKSTLLRIMAGVQAPTRGTIFQGSRLSWPVGFAGGLNKKLSARDNCLFFARIYGFDPEEVLDSVRKFSGLNSEFTQPLVSYTSTARKKLAFALTLAIKFDAYLVDGPIGTGDKAFRLKCRKAFRKRCAEADVIMTARRGKIARKYCTSGAVLANGRLTIYDDIEEAIDMNARLTG